MVSYGLILLYLFLARITTLSQGLNPCLYNREDVLPCKDYYNANITSPSANQYTVHATRLQRGSSGLPICVKRKEGEIVQAIEDLGTAQLKFLFSPGAEKSPVVNYVNQMLVQYNVSCAKGTTAFIQFDAMNLEPRNCYDGSTKKCRDYIEIDTGAGGSTEYCGSNLPSQPFIVGTGNFTLKLRTSYYNSYSGFRVFVTCFKEKHIIDSTTCSNTEGPQIAKRATFELVDLASTPAQQELQEGRVAPTIKKPTPSPLTLTSADMNTLRSLSTSLFRVALSQARRKIHASWPPPSYSRNDPNDLNPSELNGLTLRPQIPTLRPPSRPSPIAIAESDHIAMFPQGDQVRQRRHRRVVSSGSQVLLSKKATLEAVRYKNACNPIVRAVTSSYLTVAQSVAPRQLQAAQREFLENGNDPQSS